MWSFVTWNFDAASFSEEGWNDEHVWYQGNISRHSPWTLTLDGKEIKTKIKKKKWTFEYLHDFPLILVKCSLDLDKNEILFEDEKIKVRLGE